MGVISKLKSRRSSGKKVSDSSAEAEMSFLDHLEELRWHLMRILGAVVFFGIFFFINRVWLLDEVILKPFDVDFPLNRLFCRLSDNFCTQVDVTFLAITPYEKFLKAMSISAIGGIILAFPYILWEIWRFVKPGLHVNEQRGLQGNIFVMSILFFIGIVFAYYIITPFSIQFLAGFTLSEGIENQWRIGSVISLVTQISLAGGILFEMPILVYYLTKLGVVTPAFMRAYRRHAIVILLILSAVITPPDILSQILIFIPLAGLYEVSIGISASVLRRERKREAKEAHARAQETVTSDS